jgi:hypothetical protein
MLTRSLSLPQRSTAETVTALGIMSDASAFSVSRARRRDGGEMPLVAVTRPDRVDEGRLA